MTLDNILNCNYSFIGVRWTTDDENYKIGDICRDSYDWDYDKDVSSFDTETPIELNGTCAINTEIDLYFDESDEVKAKIEAAIKNHNYCGDIIIIGGNSMEHGADENEIIIEDAVVIDIV